MTANGPDNEAPSIPANVTATVDAAAPSVTLNWDAAADDVGVAGYLVHRNWEFLAFVPNGETYTDDDVQLGVRQRYQIRAQDAAGNNSSPTDILSVTP